MSLERSSVCVVDGTGKIIRETKVEREPEALVPEEPVQVPGGFSPRSYRRRFGSGESALTALASALYHTSEK